MLAFKNIPSGNILSSSLSEIIVSASYSSFTLKVYMRNIIGPIFQENFWTYNNSASIYNINHIVEAWMRDNGYILQGVSIDIEAGSETASESFTVLYCENSDVSEVDVDTFFKESFLTSLSNRRVSPIDKLRLSWYNTKTTTSTVPYTVNYNAKLIDSDSVFSDSYSANAIKSDYSAYAEISVPDIHQRAASLKAVSKDKVRLISFSVSCDSRYAVFFVDESLKYGRTFMFRNCFNAIEYITLPASTNRKTEVERSLADIGDKSIFYDRNVTQSYEVQTGPVLHDEAVLIEQLISSHNCFVVIPQYAANGNVTGNSFVKEILITDQDCSISDLDEPQSVKFTWRYADNRPGIILADPARIFTSEYNKVFS